MTYFEYLLSILYLFDSIFPGIVLIDKLHNFQEGICFPNNDCHRKRKRSNFPLVIATIPLKALISYIRTTTEKIGLIGSVQDEIKCHNLKNAHIEKKSAEYKYM